jgi:very-short-patch-repair endonuclease
MTVFLDALLDAWGQMTGTFAFVAQAFGENWRTGLASLLDRPTALFYLMGFVAVLAALVLSGLTARNRVGYRRGRFLGANEKIFLRTLDAALGRNYRAFAQVRLAELANPADSANVHLRRRALNAVMAKSVDFVNCDVLTLDPVAVIEVDDRSHLLPERRDRDAFVNAVFAEIGLPLLRVKAQRTYSVAEFRDLFARMDLFVPPPSQGAPS